MARNLLDGWDSDFFAGDFSGDFEGANRIETAESVVRTVAAVVVRSTLQRRSCGRTCATTSRTPRDVRLGLADRIWAHTPAAMAQAADVKPKSVV